MENKKIDIPVMAELFARGEKPEYLFWVGCAGHLTTDTKRWPGLLQKFSLTLE
jgi:hypothetical protein